MIFLLQIQVMTKSIINSKALANNTNFSSNTGWRCLYSNTYKNQASVSVSLTLNEREFPFSLQQFMLINVNVVPSQIIAIMPDVKHLVITLLVTSKPVCK